ncbi:MAG: hypothetical protein JNL05_10070 [Flavobacteriales bacterium]|nr:hypothetical protein [Flavobacteriales bacterium]
MHPGDDRLAEALQRMAQLPLAHFQPLFDLLPALQAPAPQAPDVLRHEADGSLTYAPEHADTVTRLIDACYEVGVVLPIDWPAFRDQHPFHERPQLIDGFDRLQCLSALTALVRGDRFSDGLLHNHWQQGTLAHLVQRLQAVGPAH